MGRRVVRSKKRTQRRRGSQLKQRKKRSKLLKRTLKRRNSFRKKNTYKRRKTNMKRGGGKWSEEGISPEGTIIAKTIIDYHHQNYDFLDPSELIRTLANNILRLLYKDKAIKIQKNKSLDCTVDNEASLRSLLQSPPRLILNPDCRTGFQKAYHSVRERFRGEYSRPPPSIKIEELLSMNFAEKRNRVKFYGRSYA